MTVSILPISLAAILVAAPAPAANQPDISKLPPPSPKKGLTYAKDIKPIFEQNCTKCHGPEKQKSKLRVDSLQAVLKGGSSGDPAILPGQSAKSPLVHYIGYLVEEMEMPPLDQDGKPQQLSAENISLIRAWIDQGAK